MYQQIDIAPTVSVLLGLPIPSSSIGSLIPEMLTGLTLDEQLYVLHYNSKRLMEHMWTNTKRKKVVAKGQCDFLSSTKKYIQIINFS